MAVKLAVRHENGPRLMEKWPIQSCLNSDFTLVSPVGLEPTTR